MFDSKNSFLWFGLFGKFAAISESGPAWKKQTQERKNCKDEKFVEFMSAFKQSLHSKVIDGICFDDLEQKSTKDKNTVVDKLYHLERLMADYLDIENAAKQKK